MQIITNSILLSEVVARFPAWRDHIDPPRRYPFYIAISPPRQTATEFQNCGQIFILPQKTRIQKNIGPHRAVLRAQSNKEKNAQSFVRSRRRKPGTRERRSFVQKRRNREHGSGVALGGQELLEGAPTGSADADFLHAPHSVEQDVFLWVLVGSEVLLLVEYRGPSEGRQRGVL